MNWSNAFFLSVCVICATVFFIELVHCITMMKIGYFALL